VGGQSFNVAFEFSQFLQTGAFSAPNVAFSDEGNFADNFLTAQICSTLLFLSTSMPAERSACWCELYFSGAGDGEARFEDVTGRNHQRPRSGLKFVAVR